jgi:hypothetical protein
MENITHIFAICNKNEELDRYEDIEKWISKDFDESYYTIDSYCWGNNLKQDDLSKYNIIECLNKGNKSLYLNHIKIFEKILNEYKSGQNFLILESDSVPIENYKEIINEQLNILKDKSWDYLDVGNGCSWTPEKMGHTIINGNNVYLCNYSRAAHSIVWSYEGIKKFYNFFVSGKITITKPIDYMFWQVMQNVDPHVYWGHPFAFKQGSQCGIYQSNNT